jgi:hypothetical protein
VVFGALIGAIAWNIITWYYGIPSSSSHALIGGLAGAAMAKAGTGSLVWAGIGKVVAFILIAPLLGFILGGTLMVIVSWLSNRSTPRKVDKSFRRLQLVSAAFYSLGHGGNDAQKTIGIIWMLLLAAGISQTGDSVPIMGGVFLLRGDGPGHDVRRLAHRQDHGAAHYQVAPGRRFLRRDGRRDHPVHGHYTGHTGVYNAHDHRRHRRRRYLQGSQQCALGRGWQHRLGLGSDHPGQCADSRDRLVGGAVPFVICRESLPVLRRLLRYVPRFLSRRRG